MLRLEAVHAFYGAGHILHGVDLTIAPAKVTAVLGRNGVGKTTTVRAIMGLVPPRGRVWLGADDIAGWPPHRIARAGVAYVRSEFFVCDRDSRRHEALKLGQAESEDAFIRITLKDRTRI